MNYYDKINLIQDEASTALIEAKKSTVHIRTGLGKTFISFKALNKIPREKDQLLNVLFLAETRVREKTLNEEILKFKKLFNIDINEFINLEFNCYQTAYKWKNKHFDVVIADRILFA